MPHFDWLALTVCGESLIQFPWCMSGVILGGIWLWGIQINSRKYWTGRQLCTKPYGIQHIRQWVASLALRTRGLRSLKLFDGLGNQSPSRGSPSDVSALIYHISPTTRAPELGWGATAFQPCILRFASFLPFCFDRMEQFNMEPGRMIGLGRKAISHINEPGSMVIRSLGVKYVTMQNRHIRHFRMLHF